jgi:hypothetical protein
VLDWQISSRPFRGPTAELTNECRKKLPADLTMWILRTVTDGVPEKTFRILPGNADLESTNGTYVNGTRIESARLASGDRVQVGRVELVALRETD